MVLSFNLFILWLGKRGEQAQASAFDLFIFSIPQVTPHMKKRPPVAPTTNSDLFGFFRKCAQTRRTNSFSVLISGSLSHLIHDQKGHSNGFHWFQWYSSDVTNWKKRLQDLRIYNKGTAVQTWRRKRRRMHLKNEPLTSKKRSRRM